MKKSQSEKISHFRKEKPHLDDYYWTMEETTCFNLISSLHSKRRVTTSGVNAQRVKKKIIIHLYLKIKYIRLRRLHNE